MHYKPTDTPPPNCDQPSVGLARPPVPPARPEPNAQVNAVNSYLSEMSSWFTKENTKLKHKTN